MDTPALDYLQTKMAAMPQPQPQPRQGGHLLRNLGAAGAAGAAGLGLGALAGHLPGIEDSVSGLMGEGTGALDMGGDTGLPAPTTSMGPDHAALLQSGYQNAGNAAHSAYMDLSDAQNDLAEAQRNGTPEQVAQLQYYIDNHLSPRFEQLAGSLDSNYPGHAQPQSPGHFRSMP